jgi:hypothetical protein
MRRALALTCVIGCQARPASTFERPGPPPSAAEASQAAAAPVGLATIESTCAGLRDEATEMTRDAVALYTSGRGIDDDQRRFLDSLGHCHAGDGGAWVLMPLDVSADDIGEGERELSGAVAIVHVNPMAKRARYEQAFLAHLVTTPDAGNDAIISVLSHHDYDGDGVEELVVEANHSGYDLNESTFAIYTRVGNAIEPYGPSEAITIESMVDYDGDGAFDIVSIQDYWVAPICFGMTGDEKVGVPPVLFHARPDGSFSATDAIAERFLRQQCPAPPGTLLVGGELEWEIDARRRIACARAWGKTADQVKAQIRQEWRTLAPSDTRGDASCELPRTTFESFAEIDPPVVLRR